MELSRSPIDPLSLVVQGTVKATGEEFFRVLVQSLANALQVKFAMVAEFSEGPHRVRTRAFWAGDRLIDNVEYDLAGTPCQEVLEGSFCLHPADVARQFPLDQMLSDWNIESYMGIPLRDANGSVLGHLAVFDEQPMPDDRQRLMIFEIFASRVAGELVRLRLLEALAASESRYRDLFDQAPIPYVYEDTETRFIRVNKAAMDLLGLSPQDVPGTVGMTLVAQHRANKDALDRAFDDIRQGRERGLVELELKRKDNGQPIWVQFWSRPEPDGKHTRTMIIDITARVLAERERARLQSQNTYLQEEIRSSLNFEEIVGRSPALAAVLENVRAVAPTDSSVLITGETGTGKELIARAIHSTSRRRDKPLIKVNCAALPQGLLESELFGHEKGAFTGALQKRIGRFELAEGGTIFLDEIGDLPIEMQAKLLRVLQEHELERVGGGEPIAIDVRVIAATNRNLETAIADRTFREDLYYRLNVFPIRLPPLRERSSDIPLLANYFASHYAAQFGKPIVAIESATVQRMCAYTWPGNIRELQNVVERAAILCPGPELVVGPDILKANAQDVERATGQATVSIISHPPPASGGAGDAGATHLPTLEQLERAHIQSVLNQTGWRIDGDRGAARILGLNPNTLRSRLKKLGLERPH